MLFNSGCKQTIVRMWLIRQLKRATIKSRHVELCHTIAVYYH